MGLGALLIQECMQLTDRETPEYHQQFHMYQTRSHQIDDRIVSIHQPHVRLIVRGKAKAQVEFGAKLAVSMTKGNAFLYRAAWDNFNESTTLNKTIENYRRRLGYYSAVVQADQIYRTRENRKFCKQHGIRLSSPALGRPRKDGSTNEQRNQDKHDAGERNDFEGKFGEGKRKYGLGPYSRASRADESVSHHAATAGDKPGTQAARSFEPSFVILLRRRPSLNVR